MSIRANLLAISRLAAEVADNPRLLPSFILIVADDAEDAAGVGRSRAGEADSGVVT